MKTTVSFVFCFFFNINTVLIQTYNNKIYPLQNQYMLAFISFNGFRFSSYTKEVNTRQALSSLFRSPSCEALAYLLLYNFSKSRQKSNSQRKLFLFFFGRLCLTPSTAVSSNRPAGELCNNPFYQAYAAHTLMSNNKLQRQQEEELHQRAVESCRTPPKHRYPTTESPVQSKCLGTTVRMMFSFWENR